ncbi:MAG: YesL family protein [Eubacteriales bacterium]|nr:YesL family protein [Eubacteriales bacterium]
MKEAITTFLTDTVGRVVDYFCLNLIFMITCLPIITIGCSSSAMYYVIFHMLEDKDAHLTRQYLKAWKDNFVKSTILWIFALFLLALSYECISFLSHMGLGTMTLLFYALLLLFLYLLCSTLIFFFSLQARFENTLKQTLKNAWILAMRNPKISIVGIFIELFPVILAFLAPGLTYTIIGAMLLIGFAFQFYLLSRLFFPLYEMLAEA